VPLCATYSDVNWGKAEREVVWREEMMHRVVLCVGWEGGVEDGGWVGVLWVVGCRRLCGVSGRM
jgi:hypothetical protein